MQIPPICMSKGLFSNGNIIGNSGWRQKVLKKVKSFYLFYSVIHDGLAKFYLISVYQPCISIIYHLLLMQNVKNNAKTSKNVSCTYYDDTFLNILYI